jgi:acetyl-CoA carboxylase beta subunit
MPCWATSTWPSPGAEICFAGKRVIEQTIREKLPEGFQTSEYLLEHGMVDMVIKRHDIPDTLARVLKILTKKPADRLRQGKQRRACDRRKRLIEQFHRRVER